MLFFMSTIYSLFCDLWKVCRFFWILILSHDLPTCISSALFIILAGNSKFELFTCNNKNLSKLIQKDCNFLQWTFPISRQDSLHATFPISFSCSAKMSESIFSFGVFDEAIWHTIFFVPTLVKSLGTPFEDSLEECHQIFSC